MGQEKLANFPFSHRHAKIPTMYVSLSRLPTLKCSSAPDSVSCFWSSFTEGSHISWD